MIAWDPEVRNRLNQILDKYSQKDERQSNQILPVKKVPEVRSKAFGCADLFNDFCHETTIHGVKYMGDRNRHWAEKLWWLIAFLLSICGCGFLIMNVYNRWDRSPVIVTFAEKPTKIHQVPFPAVTFCLQTKVMSNLLNYTEVYRLIRDVDHGNFQYNFTQDEIYKIDAVTQVCDPNIENTTVGTFFTTTKIVDILEDLAPQLTALFFCQWRSLESSCTDFFSMILTEEGICYTFNNLAQSEIFREENLHDDYRYIESQNPAEGWSMETGYSQNSSLSSYPERVQAAGARSGLSIILPLSIYDLDFVCRGPSQGFKVQIHAPGEIPRLSQQFFRLSLEQEIILSVKPNMITTSEALRSYAINRRQCYFQGEKYLRFFKIYTQQNCELECLTNYTLMKCGCVKFSMPRDKKTKICGARSVLCYYEAEDELFNPYEGPTHEELGCDCLPSCTGITYDAETSQADFDWRKYLEAHGAEPGSFPGDQLGRMVIFFRDSQFITSKRSELFGATDFLSNCGGLLGLFMGVSILSLVEVLYFSTLRLWYRFRKYRDDRSRKVNFIRRLP